MGKDFAEALTLLKHGARVARAGWNGKGMWLCLSPGGMVTDENLWAPANKRLAIENGGSAKVLPYITMKTAQGDVVPWVASQSDLLAEDWILVVGETLYP